MRMFLDDIRVPIENYDIVVRSYDEAFDIHSANPIGKNNLKSILNNYLLFKVKY